MGLALGTVALASLFTACTELIDLFELSRSYEYDYDLACLKLSLLKARLDTSGKCLSIDEPGHEPSLQLQQNWPKEQDIIVRSLLGIKSIFGNAEVLKYKYRLLPRQPNSLSSMLAIRAKSSTIADHRPPSSSRSPNSSRHRSLFRRSTTWAIRDRQKFDALLSDLEFFISNLEHVVSRLTMAKQPKGKDRKIVDSGFDGEGDEDATDDDNTRDALQKTKHVGPDSRDTTKGDRKAQQEKSKISSGDSGRAWSKGGRDFKVEHTSGQAIFLQGVQGNPISTPPTAPGQRDSYTVGKMEDQSFGMQGDNSDQSIRDVLKNREALIQATRSDASTKRSQYPSQSTKFIGPGRSLGA